VYGIVDGEEAGARLAGRLSSALSAAGDAGNVYCGPFRMDGARVWRANDQALSK
jgi:hypothetical protein